MLAGWAGSDMAVKSRAFVCLFENAIQQGIETSFILQQLPEKVKNMAPCGVAYFFNIFLQYCACIDKSPKGNIFGSRVTQIGKEAAECLSKIAFTELERHQLNDFSEMVLSASFLDKSSSEAVDNFKRGITEEKQRREGLPKSGNFWITPDDALHCLTTCLASGQHFRLLDGICVLESFVSQRRTVNDNKPDFTIQSYISKLLNDAQRKNLLEEANPGFPCLSNVNGALMQYARRDAATPALKAACAVSSEILSCLRERMRDASTLTGGEEIPVTAKLAVIDKFGLSGIDDAGAPAMEVVKEMGDDLETSLKVLSSTQSVIEVNGLLVPNSFLEDCHRHAHMYLDEMRVAVQLSAGMNETASEITAKVVDFANGNKDRLPCC